MLQSYFNFGLRMTVIESPKAFLFGFILILFLNHCETRNYNVKFKAIYCYNIDSKYVKNATCRIKAKRGTLGMADKIFIYQKGAMKDVWVIFFFV